MTTTTFTVQPNPKKKAEFQGLEVGDIFLSWRDTNGGRGCSVLAIKKSDEYAVVLKVMPSEEPMYDTGTLESGSIIGFVHNRTQYVEWIAEVQLIRG